MVLLYSSRKNNMNLLVFHLILAACFIFLVHHQTMAEWVNHGGDLKNQRNAVREFLINRKTVRHLRLRWRFAAGSDVSATPAVANRAVYFPSWDGNLYAVDAFTGKLKWKRSIGQLINGLLPPATNKFLNVSISITTPTVAGNLLICGIYGPAVVIAVKRSTGKLVWSTRIDPQPLSVITMSGTVYSWGFYVGVSSLEMNSVPAEQCCTFRGSMVKLDVRTGTILWKTFTVHRDKGGKLGDQYSGAGIWGSSPSIDTVRGLVYVGTGQLFSVPAKVKECQTNNRIASAAVGGGGDRDGDGDGDGGGGSHHQHHKCIGPNVHYNSILALDLNFGMIRWSRQLSGHGISHFLCSVPNNKQPDCLLTREQEEQEDNYMDDEFGESPMLLTLMSTSGTRSLDVLVAVQKSGFAWTLDRDHGNVVWFKKAGPGSQEGGGAWGAATDGYRAVYTNIVNGHGLPFRLAPSRNTTTTGGWVAMSSNSGRILWTTANPSNETSPGPVTLVNGVLFAGSVAPSGPFYALNSRTGKILWSYETGASIYGGASSSYGCVYVGTGYSVNQQRSRFHPSWSSGNSVFAFCID